MVGGGGEGQVVLAQQPQQDDLQQMLANELMAGQLAPRLLEHQPQAADDLIPAGVEMGLDTAAGVGRHLQAVHPQHNVFHGAAGLTQLRMEHPGVDDDQVPAADGKLPALQLKTALPSEHEKQFGVIVGVESGIPLLAVLRPGNAQQLRLLFREGGKLILRNRVILAAQKNPPPPPGPGD